LNTTKDQYKAIVIGTSAGGLDALAKVLPALRGHLPVPILVVQHISASSDSYLVEYLNKMSSILVKEAEDKEVLRPSTVYFAPPDYHLMVEEDFTIALSNDEKVRYSRPSIDVLFETASWAYGSHLIGVIMTGANDDGSLGLKTIKEAGGYTIVENPESAVVKKMPESAILLSNPDLIIPVDKIAEALNSLF
jgi:two-component system chemotaxis response regulator CheB